MREPNNTQFELSPLFVNGYEILPQSIQKKVDRHLGYLAQDIAYPGLRARKMADRDGIWEARVDRRYRFTFELSQGIIHLRAVGTHDIY